MKVNRFPTIGVLCGWSVYLTQLHAYFDRLLQAISKEAKTNHCNLLIGGSVLRHSTASNMVTAYGGWFTPPDISFLPITPENIDGLIVVAPLFMISRSKYVQGLIQDGFPVVFVNSGEEGSTVGMDCHDGVYQAMHHLLKHGHDKIAFIAGEYRIDEHTDGNEKLEAYRAFVEEHQLDSDPRLVAYGFQTREGGEQAMQQILDSKVPFTAVLASNDESACGAMNTLQRSGRRIPQDVAVVGIDDLLDARVSNPRLTTVRNPVREAGVQAVNLLLQQIEGTVQSPQTLRLPVSLTIRESCGCTLNNRMIDISNNLRNSVNLATVPTDLTVRDGLSEAITKIVVAGGVSLRSEEIHALSLHLTHAFLVSVRSRSAEKFSAAVRYLLDCTTHDSVQLWQEALSIFQQLLTSQSAQIAEFAHQLLHEARLLISQHIEWQGNTFRHRKNDALHQMVSLADKLMSALDEQTVIQVVSEELQPLGIQRAYIAVFESDKADSIAYTRILNTTRKNNMIFASREFPPPALMDTESLYQLMLVPLTIQEEQLGYMIFEASDIRYCGELTQHVAAAFHKIRLYHHAVESQRHAEEANHLKSRFLSVISHELRMPLSQIVGLSDMLAHYASSDLPQIYLQDVAQIGATARHLSSLMSDLLDLSGKQIGQFKFQRELIDILDILEGTLATGERLAQEKGLAWKVRAPRRLPKIYADKTRLRQVVSNLIANAVKFTQSGSITVTLSADEQHFTFSITDTGFGVPVAEQEAIFDEFRQSEFARERHYNGLGLGLAISKYIIELHQGVIGLQSQEDHGSTFYFSLPISTNDSNPALFPSMVQNGTVTVPNTKTILIVDDEPNILELYARMIENYAPHYGILRARNGIQALKTLQHHPVDLMLLDWQMPQMNGGDVLKMIQQEKRLSRIPIIMLTTEHLSDDDMSLLDCVSMVTLLEKGVFTLEETIHSINVALGKGTRLRGESLRLVRVTMNYIHGNYSEPLTREQIAGFVSVSQDHLNRCFQQQLNMSIMSYLTRYRISQAKKMLVHKRYSVGEIAEATGFASTAYFCRVFRSEVGISARAYRQRHLT